MPGERGEELGEVACGEGEFLDGAAIDDAAEGDGFGLEQGGVAGDFDVFGDAGGLEDAIDGDAFGDGEGGGFGGGGEAGDGELEGVLAGGEEGEDVLAVGVGGGFAAFPAGGAEGHDLDTGHDGFRRIRDGAGDGATGLSQGGRGEQHQGCGEREDSGKRHSLLLMNQKSALP